LPGFCGSTTFGWMPGELWAKAAEVPDATKAKRSAAVTARSFMN
jgi:hypothetical protein